MSLIIIQTLKGSGAVFGPAKITPTNLLLPAGSEWVEIKTDREAFAYVKFMRRGSDRIEKWYLGSVNACGSTYYFPTVKFKE